MRVGQRVRLATIVAVLLLPAFANSAAAGPEWCDSGSPPPNDFRFRPTGAPSAGSSTSWLNSTTSGELDLEAGINTLEGGVAIGMQTAIEHAGAKEPKPARERPDKPAKASKAAKH